MPGRLWALFSRRSSSKSESNHSHQSDGGDSLLDPNTRNTKKVSFDDGKVKRFLKLKLNRKRGDKNAKRKSPSPTLPKSRGNHVVVTSYFFPGPFKNNPNKAATRSANSEFWFNANYPNPPPKPPRESSLARRESSSAVRESSPAVRESSPAVRESSSAPCESSSTTDSSGRYLADGRHPGKRQCPTEGGRQLPVSDKMESSTAFPYDLDPSLHPSQQPSQVPRVKRNLVRNIVAQFNEEARRRDTYSSNENLATSNEGLARTTSPSNVIEATPENAPNHNRPFSYMVGGSSNGSTPPLGQQRSRSELNVGRVQSPTSDLIYAKVVVNGKKKNSEPGKYKTTVHTRVTPNRSTFYTSNTLGGAATTRGATFVVDDEDDRRFKGPPTATSINHNKKYFSKSTGNLLADDNVTTPKTGAKRNGCKMADDNNSYYKFDAVDDEFVRHQGSASRHQEASSRHQEASSRHQEASSRHQEASSRHQEASSRHHGVPLSNGKSSPSFAAAGEARTTNGDVKKTRRHLSSSGLLEADDGDDYRRGRQFNSLSRHQLPVRAEQHGDGGSTFTTTVRRDSPGSYETRNVEKWCENEVGPNSRKFTEHEYIHQVTMSGDDQSSVRDQKKKKTFWTTQQEEEGSSIASSPSSPLRHWTSYDNVDGGRVHSLPRKADTKRRFKGEEADRGFQNGSSVSTPSARLLTRSRSGGGDSETTSADYAPPFRTATRSPSPGYRKSKTVREDTVQKTFTKTTSPPPASKTPPGGITQYYFGQSPKEERRRLRNNDSDDRSGRRSPDVTTTTFHLDDTWRNHHHHASLSDLRRGRHFQRRGSGSDSGSGVGLLSSKLVKRADAEVNGGGGHLGGRNGYSGSVEWLLDEGGGSPRPSDDEGRRRPQRPPRSHHHNRHGDGGSAEKLAAPSPPLPPSWVHSNVDDPKHDDDVIVDVFNKNHHNLATTTTPPPFGGYTTEERRVIRKEETKRTTRHEVRTTTPVSADDDDDDIRAEERRYLEHHKQLQQEEDDVDDGGEERYAEDDSPRFDGRLHAHRDGRQHVQRDRTQRERVGAQRDQTSGSDSGRQQRHHQQRSQTQHVRGDSSWNRDDDVIDRSKFRAEEEKRSHVQKARKTADVSESSEGRHRGRVLATERRHVASDEPEDKMETSESEPQLYGGGGSQDSHMSVASHVSSADDGDEMMRQQRAMTADDVIASHVNTPQSMVKQLNKQQISYENQQQTTARHETADSTSSSGGRRFWFERTATDDEEDVRRARTRLDDDRRRGLTLTNRNHYHQHQQQNNNKNNNNNTWTSATMSRLETSKNRRNQQEDEMVSRVNTVDRRRHHHQKRQNDVRGGSDDIRIQLNGRDVVDDAGHRNQRGGNVNVDRSPSFNSRLGISYHSENESQHSAGSSGSAKKRVNFKSRHGSGDTGKKKANGGHSSRMFGVRSSDLSPIHREALLRSASPARAPSTSGSLKSNESEASQGSSNKSVILHATAVADIPPAREYQYRSANISPAPPPSVSSLGGSRESRTVQRSFSLLSPWKPRKYKDKYEKGHGGKKSNEPVENGGRRRRSSLDVDEERHVLSQANQRRHERQSESARNRTVAEGEVSSSRASSSERLDSLPPLPSEDASSPAAKGKNKKKSTGLLRRHSMPKDSRFANLFRRKKDAKK